jgi:hypothetical protein
MRPTAFIKDLSRRS